MNAGSLSRRYAKALMSLGVEMRSSEQFGKELKQFADIICDEVLCDVLSNPTYPLSKRKAILEEIAGKLRPSETVRNFVMLMLDRNRITIIGDVYRAYVIMTDEHAGRIRAAVTSARPLSRSDATKIKSAIEKQTGKEVLLNQNTDEELIAGTVTQIGSVIYDGSIRTQLAEMRRSLVDGRS